MSFEYPKHPNTDRKDPFRGEDGRNLFADDDPAEVETSENPYGVVNSDGGGTYQESGFETVFSHRGRRVLFLGFAGALMSLLGATGTIACAFSLGGTGMLLSLATGLLVLGLPCAWSAWMMGRHDLRAIQAGAMERAGYRKTRSGYVLGLIGTLIALAPLVVAVGMFLKVVGEEF